MPKGNVSECNHSKAAPSPHDPSLYICSICSSLLLESQNSSGEKTFISTIKPLNFSSQLEIIPSFLSQINFSIFSQKKIFFQNKQEYLKYRSDCIKKLKSICNALSLSQKTYFLALDYFDRICSKIKIFIKDYLEDIIFFCLILASKFYENFSKNEEVRQKIKKKNIFSDEIYILSLLDFELNNLTAHEYIKEILNFGFVFEGESIVNEKKLKNIYLLVEKIAYIFTENNLYIDMTPYQIAIGVIAIARKLLGLEPFSELFKRVFISNNNNRNNNYVNNNRINNFIFDNNLISNNSSSSNSSNNSSNFDSSNEEEESDSTEVNNTINESKNKKRKNLITKISINNNKNSENSFENIDSNLDYENYFFNSFSRINRCFKFEDTPLPLKK